MMSDLTMRVLAYQHLPPSDVKRRRLEFQRICDECRIIFYTYPVRIRVLKQEDASELLLLMENRLRKIIETFSFERISFENYLCRIAYLQAQSLLRRQAREGRRYRSLFRNLENVDGENVADQSPVYYPHLLVGEQECAWSEDSEASRILKQKIKHSKTFRNRFLLLVLLASEELNANQVTFLARYLDMNERTLARKLSELHDLSRRKRERTEFLASIRNRHFSTQQFLRQELVILEEYHADPLLMERVREKLEREERHLAACVAQMRKRPNPVSHSLLAKKSGVPKGTIDSGLHAMHKYVRQIMDGIE
ncbi:MAG: hypothetical protein PHR90_05935 [Sphaerochaetaceae bacterium]|nr:hypothetical protein [Sphaerochaetaceae bacterium]